MNRLSEKVGLVFLVSLFSLAALFAGDPSGSVAQVSGYAIGSYSFSVNGKTKEFALRKAIVPQEEPVYGSEEELVKALDKKKQLLDNKRIFSSVSYTYALASYEDGTALYDVHFTIDDAFTLLPIPYAKYNNDDVGLRFGMKVYNKNLFGTFADLYMVGHISQGNGGLTGWENREDYLELSISSLPLGSTMFGLSVEYEHTKSSGEPGDFSFDLDWTGLKLFGIPLSLAPSATFDLSSDFQQWDPSEIGLTTDLGPFVQSEAMYSLHNETEYTYDTEKLYTYTYLKQHELTLFRHPLDFKLSVEAKTSLAEGEGLDYLNVGPTMGMGFSLPFDFSLYSSIGAFLHFEPYEDPLKNSFLAKASLKRSSVDWKGNFRVGSSLSLSYTTELFPQDAYNSEQYRYVEGHATWFMFATKHFNPSLRFTGFLSDADKSFLPSDSDEVLADYFRGILQNNELLQADSNTYVAVMNLNLTATFIDLKDFADTYITPFVDIGVLNDPDDPTKPLVVATAGAEGYVIFDKYPGFPIRGSLGINLLDLKETIDNGDPLNDVEFEISIGMGLFF